MLQPSFPFLRGENSLPRSPGQHLILLFSLLYHIRPRPWDMCPESITPRSSMLFSPECHYDGGWLGTCCDEGDYEKKNQEWDEGIAGPFALPGHSIAILVEIRFDNNHAQLTVLSHGGGGDHLPALDTGAFRVIPYLRDRQEKSQSDANQKQNSAQECEDKVKFTKLSSRAPKEL